jgi:hypothetical protein
MLSLVAKLLLFVAVLAAPLGMTAAPAAPAHHGTTAAMPMEHCPDQQQAPEHERGIADCAMGCSAALPALGSPPPATLKSTSARGVPAISSRLNGRQLDIATPPPKTLLKI